LKKNLFEFDQTNLSRIDLCYDRRLKQSDRNESFESFSKQVQLNSSIVETSENIVKIGKRKGSKFFRIYLQPNGRKIQFELELKEHFAKKFQYLLFSHQLNDLKNC